MNVLVMQTTKLILLLHSMVTLGFHYVEYSFKEDGPCMLCKNAVLLVLEKDTSGQMLIYIHEHMID